MSAADAPKRLPGSERKSVCMYSPVRTSQLPEQPRNNNHTNPRHGRKDPKDCASLAAVTPGERVAQWEEEEADGKVREPVDGLRGCTDRSVNVSRKHKSEYATPPRSKSRKVNAPPRSKP